jgi:hypothetical protein
MTLVMPIFRVIRAFSFLAFLLANDNGSTLNMLGPDGFRPCFGLRTYSNAKQNKTASITD